METNPILLFICCVCVSSFAVSGLALFINNIQTIVNDHKKEKREQEQAARDKEYHEKRMQALDD